MQPLLFSLLLQAPAGGGSPMIIMSVGMIAVMYFFMFRPQQKRQKEQKAFSDSIGTDEKIITASGIHGRINRVNDDGTLQVEIARNVYITIERSAVSMELTQAQRKKSSAIVPASN